MSPVPLLPASDGLDCALPVGYLPHEASKLKASRRRACAVLRMWLDHVYQAAMASWFACGDVHVLACTYTSHDKRCVAGARTLCC